MIVTEEEYDRWPSEYWEELSHEGRTRQMCDNCAHNGCCDGLPNCGGRYWKEAEDDDGE
jgi:hypothetical protein